MAERAERGVLSRRSMVAQLVGGVAVVGDWLHDGSENTLDRRPFVKINEQGP